MKVSCPNCKKVLQAPDNWAGQKVKCPACKRPIALPTTPTDDDGLDLDFDLGSLTELEDAGEVVARRRGRKLRLKDAEAAVKAQAADEPEEPVARDPHIRVCPQCGMKARHEDIYSELMCRHCGGSIPGTPISKEAAKVQYSTGLPRITTRVSFYTGFGSAAVYPMGAVDSILKAMGIALAAILIPLLGILAFTQSSTFNSLVEKDPQSSAWVGIFLAIMFGIEAIYFGAVGYYALIDTIRTTSAGSDKAATLTWNPVNLGAALGGYMALLAFYTLIVIALVGHLPTSFADVQSISSPWKLFLLAALTFAVPMNIIGLASSHALDGLNMVKVFRSIGNVIGAYTFLFLIVLLYLGAYVGVMVTVMGWAGPAILESSTKGLSAGFLNMLLGVGAWAVVMGLGFYFAYSIGRILGLFSRTYKAGMEFEL